MKTIEEAALEYAKNVRNAFEEDDVNFDSSDELMCKKDYQAGAAFAEEWISVEDEPLPKDCIFLSKSNNNDNEICLAKWNEPMQIFNVIANGIHLSDYKPVSITHFRPINKK